MKKSYVVSVKSPSDWPEIHKILTQDGTLEDNIPSHACVCVDEKPNSSNRATYLLDDEEAELIRNHEKVKYVGLDQKVYFSEFPEFFPKPTLSENRFSGNVKNYRQLYSNNPPPTSPNPDELNRTGWQLGRIESKEDVWESNSAYNFDPNSNVFRASSILKNPSYRTGEDGSGIDCVVTDDAVWLGHPEFVNNGVTQVRDIILDGPYYLDKEYFDSNNLTTTFLGRTTSQEEAAREWWRDNTKRSGRFINAGTITVSDYYTRANACGDFSSKPNFDASHGTPVASIMYGKTHGWAFNSNKWSIAGFGSAYQAYLVDIVSGLDAVRIWHTYKPKVSGAKNPTVVNSSWGYVDYVANRFSTYYWWYYNFRGQKSYFANKNDAPRFLKNFVQSNNSRYAGWLNPNGSWSGQIVDAGEDLVNLDGLIWCCSASNENQKQVTPLDADYDNWWSSKPNPEEYEKRFVNRRGFPAQCGYVPSTNTYKVFSIGALDCARFSRNGLLGEERKTFYSNAGTGVDILSPSEGTLGASGKSTTDNYKRYDSASYYSWLNTEAYDAYFNGTSAGSPAFAGFLASIFAKRKNWDWNKFKKYIKYIVTTTSSSSLYNGPGDINDANSFDWTDLYNLHGQESKIIYNEAISKLTFTKNLTDTSLFEGDKLTLEVLPTSPSNNSITSFTYQWEKRETGEASFTAIPGEIFSKLIVLDISLDDDGTEYRCFIDSDGPYDPEYSATSILSVSPTSITILSQPTSITDAIVGKTVSFTFIVDDIGSLSYQWERKLSGSDDWFDLPGETKTTLSFKTNTADEKAKYRCLVAWNGGVVSKYTDEVLLDLGDQIAISKEPLDVNIYSSESIVMTVDASLLSEREGILSYQWEYSTDRLKWLPVSGQTFSIYVKDDAETTNAGFYRCKITESISLNSPFYSRVVTVLVNKPPINIVTQPIPAQVLEGDSIFFSANASLPPGINLIISYQWQYSTNKLTWTDLSGFVNKSIYIPTSEFSDTGFYRCKISSSRALTPVVYTDPAFLEVSKQNISIALDKVTSKTITLGQSVKFEVDANFVGETPFYKWEVRDSSTDTSWDILQNSRRLNYLEFVPTIFDHKKQYRCVVYNNAGYSATSNIATLTISPTYQIVNNTSISEIFSRNDDEFIYLYIDVISTYTSTPLYQWQRYSGSWINLVGENQKSLRLNVASLPNSSMYRCRVSLGNGGGTIFGNECLVEENTLLNLYKGRCDDLLTGIQEDAVDDIIANPLVINTDCAKNVVNTCGMSIEQLLEMYEFYDYQKGLFKSWGDINFPWKIAEVSSNLIYSESDDKWGISAYKGIIVYPTGSKVLLIEEDGYIISLYEATDNVLSISGAFDYSKWKKICEVRTSVPAGLPSPDEVIQRFEEYALERFITSWGEMNLKFNENAYEKTLSDCLGKDLNLVDFQKCINSNSSDQWNNVRNKKDFFYRKGDRFYVQGECGDTLCIYFVKNDIPVTEEFYSEFKVFKESQFWEKIYCVSTGRNKCLEYTRRKEPELGYDVIELGSNNHFVEMPVPYRLKPPQKTLDSMAEIKQNPRILSQEEIDNLNQP